MSDTTTPLPAADPLRALVEEWSRSEVTRAEDLDRLIAPLEEAVERLAEWADRIALVEQAEAERQQEAEAREQAAEDRRRRLEHDLKLARARVRELEQGLQERTEELLRAQAANNALAAELQSIESDDSLETDPLDDEVFENLDPIDDSEHAEGEQAADNGEHAEAAESDGGVAERFARLRRS
ncbi:MAG: hypothetical protein AAF266_07920 [Planctomycetota bacterium]